MSSNEPPHSADGHGSKSEEIPISPVISQPLIEETPYSVFTKTDKWAMVFMTSLAGLLSPLTANIYLPAIPVVADAFHKSTELINLTVTMYMVFQGISPMLWGTIADRSGRRPVYLACLLVLCLACMGAALVPTNAYWLLLLLRCAQAAGSASTVALGAGVVVDVATESQRGSFLGISLFGALFGPCIGPIIGGVLSGTLGWRSTFWFISIFSGVVFIFMLLTFPETLRSMVGNGSVAPPKLNRPPIPLIKRHYSDANYLKQPKKPLANPFRLFVYPDVLLLLIYNAMCYSVYVAVNATIAVLFEQKYPFLSQVQTGLCYIAIGTGTIIGAVITGKLLDREYRRIQDQMDQKDCELGGKPMVREKGIKRPRSDDFPIERARLRLTPLYVSIFVATVIGYGWCLEAGVHISVPLILSFFIGWTSVGILNCHQNLIMDLFPSQGSSITAANNLVRCTSGAALVAVIDLIFNAINPGWTYTLLAGLCAVGYGMSYYEMINGHRWRKQRRDAERERLEKQRKA